MMNAMKSLSAGELLADFFDNSNVGLAIFDDQLRYQALNPYLAAMHGIPAECHLGKTLRDILGEIASQVEPAVKQVLTTGQPIFNIEVAGALPTKRGGRRWVDNLFPLKDAYGRVKQVGAVVLELRSDTKQIPARRIANFESLPNTANEVLRSWKEIANYVGASVKTIQRWEQRHQFPVRRLRRSKGAVVFAMRLAVDSWIELRSSTTSQAF